MLIEKLYLEYVNDFLTVARFAEHHGINPNLANAIIEEGRKINQGPSEPKTKYILYVETDWDFGLEFKGKKEADCEITLILDSVEQLDEIKVLGAFGAPHKETTKDWEWKAAVEAIKKNPDEHFSSTGGNRGVQWTPTKVEQPQCPMCGHIDR